MNSILTKIVKAGLILILFSTGCKPTQHSRISTSEQLKTIEILAVNDMHANIDNLPRLSFMADSLRALYPHLLLVSAGDNQTGNPVNDQYPEQGMPIIELMNTLKFELSAVGNHEFDAKPDGMSKLLRKARFDFISANVHPKDIEAYPIKPYKILKLNNGLKVAFVSVIEINKNGIPDSHPDNMGGFTFREPNATAKQYLYLKDSCDILIYLNHFGFENDVNLANQFPQGVVDLIIGGHSHTKVDKEEIHNGILITQAESRLKYATLIKINVNARGKVSKNMQLLPVGKNGNVSPKTKALVDNFNDNPYLNTPIATATDDFSSRIQLGYLMTDALRTSTNTDIALLNPGGVRMLGLEQGKVSIKDVFLMDPFGNNVVLFTLNGHEIKSFLTSAFGFDEYGVIIPSGLTTKYQFDQNGKISDLQLFLPGGQPLNLEKDYRVAMNSYMASVYHFEHRFPATILAGTTAEEMISYLRKISEIPSYRNENRIEIIR